MSSRGRDNTGMATTLTAHKRPADAEPLDSPRLAAVRRYGILDTPADGHFDRITGLASRIFDVPVSIVSIVDVDRVWFMSHHGTDAEEASRGPGLCASAILGDTVWVSQDARSDPRTLANPLVANDFGLRFYAGAPLITTDGFRLGTLCIIDRQPRELTPDDEASLTDLAAIVITELDLRLAARKVRRVHVAAQARAEQIAVTDHLTGVPNRRAFEKALAEIGDSRGAGRDDVAVAMIDVDGLKLVNDLQGHHRGDELLQIFARSLARAFRSADRLYRIGGDEFTILLPVAGSEDVQVINQRIAAAIEHTRQAGFPAMDASVGVALLSEAGWSPDDALALADARMYALKPQPSTG